MATPKCIVNPDVLRSRPRQQPARVVTVVYELAREHGLSVYDASYLDLALREDLPLATLDRRLAEAARRCGVAPA